MIGVVLAGGYGKRLLPLTKEKPKSFLEIGGKQLLDYSVEILRNAGIRKIVVIVPPGYENMAIPRDEDVYIVGQKGEDIRGGIYTAVLEAKKRNEDQVMIAYSGFLASPGIGKAVIDYYASSGYPIVIGVSSVSTGLETYGFVTIDYRGQITSYNQADEKTRTWLKNRGYVFAGLIVSDVNQLERLSKDQFESAMAMVSKEGIVGGIIWNNKWIEVGYPWDLLDALKIILNTSGIKINNTANVSRSAIISNGVVIDDYATIEEGAIIIGPAYIGRRAQILAGSIIKPYTSIEENAVIGENTIVSNSLIMKDAYVGALSEIRNSVIGEGAKIEESSHLIEGTPEMLPDRLKGITEFLGEVKLGAIIAPKERINPFTVIGSGKVVE
ncbi:Nucleoside-diphosphate-sugar pyrophosphorylase family protein [Caldisphaera lagunensis DSM 15908]|uniref:Nucleoside-diphosphate-sugar pyrophosphorylase family protein n=1 Tax=Caldisphaera lagunensis (strain DSM 15908 / JCM 11604 / ANMR 0165 / IC-154) TaxID=1056495 RepID=L0A9S5_CALLD|nr:NDP-sugar synthase [Caldisphaera lagunensis]AFZ70643.1 Nucleoside-diphosphate-sugar pyrophosphorylase family protein [Caldisphaera lagunensis DSM 15908]